MASCAFQPVAHWDIICKEDFTTFFFHFTFAIQLQCLSLKVNTFNLRASERLYQSKGQWCKGQNSPWREIEVNFFQMIYKNKQKNNLKMKTITKEKKNLKSVCLFSRG